MFGHEGCEWLCYSVALIRRLEEIWMLYKAKRVVVKPVKAKTLTFLTPTHTALCCGCWEVRPHGSTKPQMLGGGEDGTSQLPFQVFFFTSSLSVCFMSFVPLLMHLTCCYSISWFLQTIRRCWTYFKSMCLDWQDTVGKTGLKLSKAMPGQAWLCLSSFQDHTVCF